MSLLEAMPEPVATDTNNGFFSRLVLDNFTAFGHAELEFVGPGINVFVGENGTGKTHAMKALYSYLLWNTFTGALDAGAIRTLYRIMPAQSGSELVRVGAPEARTKIALNYRKSFDTREISREDDLANDLIKSFSHGVSNIVSGFARPVFIPAIEMMGHIKRFGDTYDTYELDFDWTIRDIVRLLNIGRREPAPEYEEVIRQLEKDALKGTVHYEMQEDRYYLVQDGNALAMPLVAEGLRKIATLHTLLRNGSIRKGTVLFWDEPEVNLNPVLMDEVVRALMAIARSGVQIFLATHSYVLLEELRDAAGSGEVRYFGFEKGENGVSVNATDDLRTLTPNPILRQYESLYNRKMSKAFAARPVE